MTDLIKVIILGIIEGVTEFLPISSTGHLIIANEYLDFTGSFANLFAVVIQVGAILSVLVYFKDRVFPKKEHFNSLTDFRRYIDLWLKVIVGIIPAGILGVLFEEKIEEYLFNSFSVSMALIAGAIILIIVESKEHKNMIISEKNITYKQAFIVGVFQCLALIPGMSRSASTIIGGLIVGFDRKVAAEFSFFLAIPTLAGAALLKLLKADFVMTNNQLFLLIVGTVVSFIVAYIVIAGLMNYIKKHNFKVFAYYRIILGIIVLLLLRG
ncbi:undecaprenyl-diphosphate phosphatase [Clostridiaceae bacterium HSG29]|nr:undecaprenyl-diphosphate phosphatase [Clostridiaceae bacterium HSG29]